MRRRVLRRDLAIPRGELFPWLADPGAYPRWLAGLDDVRVLVREGDVAVVSMRWPALARDPLVVELVQDPPVSVVFREVEREGLIAGRWDLTEMDGGRRTRLRAELGLRCGWLDPRRRRLDRLLADSVEALERLADGRGEARSGDVASGGRDLLLLEIRRAGDGLRIRWQGRQLETVQGAGANLPDQETEVGES